jgi:hypothetical protein
MDRPGLLVSPDPYDMTQSAAAGWVRNRMGVIAKYKRCRGLCVEYSVNRRESRLALEP